MCVSWGALELGECHGLVTPFGEIPVGAQRGMGHAGENGSRAVRRLAALQASGGRGLGPGWAVEEVRQDSFRQRFEGSVNRTSCMGCGCQGKRNIGQLVVLGPHT